MDPKERLTDVVCVALKWSNVKLKSQQFPQFVDWCIDCSIRGNRASVKTASESITNPALEAIWKKEVNGQGKKKPYSSSLVSLIETMVPKRYHAGLYVSPLFRFPRIAEPQITAREVCDLVHGLLWWRQ